MALGRAEGSLLGAYKPQCTATGQYKNRQCHASTGHCWCVTSDGKEINGTRKGPGQTVTCDQGNDVTLCLCLSKHIVIVVDNVLILCDMIVTLCTQSTASDGLEHGLILLSLSKKWYLIVHFYKIFLFF